MIETGFVNRKSQKSQNISKMFTYNTKKGLVFMDFVIDLIKAFAVGGAICLIGQVLIDTTKATPGRILVAFVIAGVVLTAVMSF